MRYLISALLGMLLIGNVSEAAVGTSGVEAWYVRPAGVCANNGDGLAYGCAASAGATGAFSGLANLVWTATSGIDDGDTLYICGDHKGSIAVATTAAGTSSAPIAIDFRCPNDPGSVKASTIMPEALIAEKWTNESENFWWLSSSAYSNHEPRRLWYNGSEIFPATVKAALGTNEGKGAPLAQWWYDSVSKRIYLYSDGNPAASLTRFETLVAGTASCAYTALCFTNDANDYFTVINPKLYGGNLSSLHITGADNITIYGTASDDSACLIGGLGTRGVLITDQATNGTGNIASSIAIKDCTIDPIVPAAFHNYNWQWTHNTHPSQFGDGVAFFFGTSGDILKSNTLRDWGHALTEIVANTGTTSVTNVRIEGNTMTCYNAEYCRAFAVDGTAVGRASGNWIIGNRIVGQKIRSQLNGNGNYVVGNLFVDQQQGSVSPANVQSLDMEGYKSSISQGNYILNNTFINNPYGPCISFRAGTNKKSGYLVQNNLLVGCGGTAVPGAENVSMFVQNSANVGNQTFSNNAIYHSAITNTVHYKAMGPTTVSGFQAVCSGDVCSENLATDPLVINTQNGQLALTSPMKKAGTRLRTRSPSHDEEPLDIGAYQLSGKDLTEVHMP